jgi:hypothetical protein
MVVELRNALAALEIVARERGIPTEAAQTALKRARGE